MRTTFNSLQTVTNEELAVLTAANAAAIVPANLKQSALFTQLLSEGYLTKTASGKCMATVKGRRELDLALCAADQPRHYHTDGLVAPLSTPYGVHLTDDERRRDCILFLLPADINGIGKDVVAVCEPVVSWKWLEKGALIVYNEYYEWEEAHVPVGEQLHSCLETHVGRVVEVGSHELTLSLGEDQFLNEGGVVGEDCRDIWKIVRAAAVHPALAQVA